MVKPFYITTPAYYVNNVPHLGHAYTTLATDVITRWHKLKGEKVRFVTGTDEHGAKVEEAAEKHKILPQVYADRISKAFQETWSALHIEYDDFVRTTEERHKLVVNDILKRIWDNGDIYKGFYEDWYCVPCESFWTEAQLFEKACPTCGRSVEKLKEETYYFKLSKYDKKLLTFYKNTPQFILPTSRKNEIIKRVEEGLRDLSITRTSLKWGIPFPFDKNHVLYVWTDALNFYLTGVGYPQSKNYSEFWPPDVQIMAKEILWFHAVIFPALLMSAKLPLAKQLFAHGWITVDGKKMGKSVGNVVDPVAMVQKYGVDAFRYYLLRDIPFGQDGDFSEKRFVERVNSELVNELGNLLSRTLTLAEKFTGTISGKGTLLISFKDIDKTMQNYELHHVLDLIFSHIKKVNKYVNDQKPWELKGESLSEVLYNLLESLRMISILLFPFMPETAQKICTQLGVSLGTFEDLYFKKWTTKVKKGTHLFTKL